MCLPFKFNAGKMSPFITKRGHFFWCETMINLERVWDCVSRRLFIGHLTTLFGWLITYSTECLESFIGEKTCRRKRSSSILAAGVKWPLLHPPTPPDPHLTRTSIFLGRFSSSDGRWIIFIQMLHRTQWKHSTADGFFFPHIEALLNSLPSCVNAFFFLF